MSECTQAIESFVNKAHDEFNLIESTRLVPILHNALIYEKGQFFKTHQDTEKQDNMIATLVVVLPFDHSGGELSIQHKETTKTFRYESAVENKCQAIAFYSNCRHDINFVKEGYRIALTFNLILEKSENTSVDTYLNKELKESIEKYFENKLPDAPLYFALDYEYSQKGLKWHLLKGIDRLNAYALLAATVHTIKYKYFLALGNFSTEIQCHNDEYDPVKELFEKHKDIRFLEEITIHTVESSMSHIVDLFSQDAEFEFDLAKIEEMTNHNSCWFNFTPNHPPSYVSGEPYQGNWGGEIEAWYSRAFIIIVKN
jgi:hypothetical protein